jgi:hypothetical protein
MHFAKLTLLLERKAKAGDRGDLTSFGYTSVGKTYVFIAHVQSMTRLDAMLSDDDLNTTEGQVTEVYFSGRSEPVYVAEAPKEILRLCGVKAPHPTEDG